MRQKARPDPVLLFCCFAPVKPIEYYVKQSCGRDAGICEAVNDGQHSMTDIANALALSVSRVSRIVGKAMSEAKGKA